MTITNEQADAVRRLSREGMSGLAIARRTGVSKATVQLILRGKWRLKVPAQDRADDDDEGEHSFKVLTINRRCETCRGIRTQWRRVNGQLVCFECWSKRLMEERRQRRVKRLAKG